MARQYEGMGMSNSGAWFWKASKEWRWPTAWCRKKGTRVEIEGAEGSLEFGGRRRRPGKMGARGDRLVLAGSREVGRCSAHGRALFSVWRAVVDQGPVLKLEAVSVAAADRGRRPQRWDSGKLLKKDAK